MRGLEDQPKERDTMTFREKTMEALGIAEEFLAIAPNHVSMDITGYTEHPTAKINIHAEEKNRAEIFRLALAKCGEIKKGQSASHGITESGIDLTLFGVLKCEVVGTKTRPKMAWVDTGEEEEVPVYDCKSPIEDGHG